jgi:hypothetical protein
MIELLIGSRRKKKSKFFKIFYLSLRSQKEKSNLNESEKYTHMPKVNKYKLNFRQTEKILVKYLMMEIVFTKTFIRRII